RIARAALAAALALAPAAWPHARAEDAHALPWALPQRRRLLLTVDMRGRTQANRVASADVDLGPDADPDTVEVVGYDAQGRPHVFEPEAAAPDRFVLPARLDPLYPLTRARLSFLVPGPAVTRYAVYLDGASGPRALPRRYSGLVGDGDFFREGFGRREVAPSGFDDMADLDGDGDLDLVKGGTEP